MSAVVDDIRGLLDDLRAHLTGITAADREATRLADTPAALEAWSRALHRDDTDSTQEEAP